MWNKGPKTFMAGEALEAKRRVKIKSGTTTTPPEIVYADAGEACIGVTKYAVNNGNNVAVNLENSPGTTEVECIIDTAISPGTALYGADDGRLSDAVSGNAQGIAMEAASSDYEHIEVLLD